MPRRTLFIRSWKEREFSRKRLCRRCEEVSLCSISAYRKRYLSGLAGVEAFLIQVPYFHANHSPSLDSVGDTSSNVPRMPWRQNISFIDFHWFPPHARTLPRLRPQVRAGRRLFPGSHVHQLWLGPDHHRYPCRRAVGVDPMAVAQNGILGGFTVLAYGAHPYALLAGALDLPRSGDRSGIGRGGSVLIS